ncbi:MAG: hypothetical protein HZA51_10315 [Planctomycetes bacterium]|nr:hypothetical protein [Planctomycetota bacterium]
MLDSPVIINWGNRHRLTCLAVLLLPVILGGMTCNGLCPAPDQDLSYSIIGVVNQKAFVQRSGSFAGSDINPPIVSSLAEYDIELSNARLFSCDHGGIIHGHELAWIDLNGIHIQDLETEAMVFHDPSRLSERRTGTDGTVRIRLLGLSASHLFIQEYQACCGGNEDWTAYAIDRSTMNKQAISRWGDSSGGLDWPFFATRGNIAAVIGNVRFNFQNYVMLVVDVATGTSRELLGPGPERPYLAELTDQRFIWAREGPGAVASVTIAKIFAAELESLDITELVSFENITEGPIDSRHEDRPYQLSGDYMLVSHSTGSVAVFDLWTLASPPAKIRTISTDAKPVFAGNWIVLSSSPDGPFTLINPVTDERTTIPNPFTN